MSTFVERTWLSVLGVGVAVAGLALTIAAIASPPDPAELADLPESGGDLTDLETTALFGSYLALAGFALIGIASVATRVGNMPLPSLKQCPDCPKRVPAAANVCRFCGYRFDQSATPPT